MHVVFGRVVNGHGVVTDIENTAVDAKTNKPMVPVTIMNCGELIKKKKKKADDSSSSESSSSSSGSGSESEAVGEGENQR